MVVLSLPSYLFPLSLLILFFASQATAFGIHNRHSIPASTTTYSSVSTTSIRHPTKSRPSTLLFQQHNPNNHHHYHRQATLKRYRHFLSRISNPLQNVPNQELIQTAGIFKRVRQIHNPITYLVLAALAGFRYDWCFRNPYYWFAVGFCIKWYRARYVFRIPVWDRQPNWNNIITSQEQEKDLKAYTCKNCGSTIFIAKTREFFFEGNTGIGGLGCFSCGAKGKDNFVMDRDRIVEDVADIDDYFEYERPLDFVSRAERRELLKETKGDEEAANQLLMNRYTSTNVSEEDGSSVVGGNEKATTEDIVDNISSADSDEVEEASEKTKTSSPSDNDDDDDDDLDFLDMDG